MERGWLVLTPAHFQYEFDVLVGFPIIIFPFHSFSLDVLPFILPIQAILVWFRLARTSVFARVSFCTNLQANIPIYDRCVYLAERRSKVHKNPHLPTSLCFRSESTWSPPVESRATRCKLVHVLAKDTICFSFAFFLFPERSSIRPDEKEYLLI